jgi:hypothetical protein
MSAANFRDATPLGGTYFTWLLQTAMIAFIDGAGETLRNWWGLTRGFRSEAASQSVFSSNFCQNALISTPLGRECNLYSVGYVAGQRRRRRVFRGWF